MGALLLHLRVRCRLLSVGGAGGSIRLGWGLAVKGGMETHRVRVRLVLGVVLLMLPLSTGCEIVDVVANIGSGYVDEPKNEVSAAAPTSKKQSTTAHAKLKAYYNRRTKEAAPEDPSNPIVPCKTGSGTQFLRLHDCELRGGRAS